MADDPKIRDVLTSSLSHSGYQTEIASTGFEAGFKVMAFKPGLIILDLMMPEVDGFEVCKWIKEDSRVSYIKVLAITGHDKEEERKRILESGADGYLAKPVDKERLLRNVENLLNGK